MLAESTVEVLKSHTTLTLQEALSGVFGSISLTCWLFVLVPQLVENYRNQSAEAVSLTFLIIWLFGDVTNLLGSLWANLVPTVVAIAIYFCMLDAVLLSQCLYYGIRARRREGKSWLKAARESMSGDPSAGTAEAVARVQRQQLERDDEISDEEQPLLKRTSSISARGNGSANVAPVSDVQNLSLAQRRSSMDTDMQRRRRSSAAHSNRLVQILEEQDSASGLRRWLVNTFSVFAIFCIGAVGWALAYQSGAWKPQPLHDDRDDEPLAKGAQVLGYMSATLYLGARIPQIVKNWREQSCEGMWPSTMFKFSENENETDSIPLRSIVTILHPLLMWQFDIRREHSRPLHRTYLCHQERALVNWQPRHNGGRHHHLRAISSIQ